MAGFASVTQKVFQAKPGDQLTDVVDFAGSVDFGTTPFVGLVDRSTDKAICVIWYAFQLNPFSLGVSGSIPSPQSNPVYLSMGSTPMYLQLRLFEVGVAGDVAVIDTVDLQPIAIPGQGGGGGPLGQNTGPVIALGAVAALSFIGLGINRWYRGRRRRR